MIPDAIRITVLNHTVDASVTWSNDNMTLTIDPKLNLMPDTWYEILITGVAVNGQPLRDNDGSLGFRRRFLTDM